MCWNVTESTMLQYAREQWVGVMSEHEREWWIIIAIYAGEWCVAIWDRVVCWGRVPYIPKSYRTCEWVMRHMSHSSLSQIWWSHDATWGGRVTYIKEWYRTHERVMWYIWVSHVTHMNERFHISRCECPREGSPVHVPRELFGFPVFSPYKLTISRQRMHGLGAGGKRRGWSLMRRKARFGQGLRAGHLGLSPKAVMFRCIRDHPRDSALQCDAVCCSTSAVKFRRIREPPHLFPPGPSPWIPCSEIVSVQGKQIGNPKNSLWHGQGKPSLGHSQRAFQGVVSHESTSHEVICERMRTC